MKQAVTIELDKMRNLRYGMNALIKVEELTGKPVTQLDLNNVSIGDLRALIFAGLYHEDRELTPEKVGDLIDEYSELSLVAEKLGEAMTLAFNSKNAK